MRALVLIASLSLLWPSLGQAACSGTAQACTTLVWEVRPGTGSNTNGGCFDSSSPNTDYTQQTTAQLSLSDLATSGAGITTVTSATGGFTSAMVGNCLRIESGTNFTVGWYLLTQFTDTNTISVGASPTPGGAGSSGVGAIGGATASLAGQTTTTLASIADDGHIVWVKNEAWNEAVSFSNAAAQSTPLIVEGYNSARNDDPTGSNRPTLDRNSAAGDAMTVKSFVELRNLVIREAGDDGVQCSTTFESYLFQNVRLTANTGSGYECTSRGGVVWALNSEFDTNGVSGILHQSSNNDNVTFAVGNYVHDNTGIGFDLDESFVVFNISEANGGDGFNADVGTTLLNMTLNGNTGASSDGADLPGSSSHRLLNNIFSNNGNYGVNFGTATDSDFGDEFKNYNDFYGNSTAATNNYTLNANDQTVDPGFTDATNADFSIGTNLKADGFPGTYAGSGSIGYLDVGAVQRQEPAGGGASAYTFVGGQ